MKKKLIPLLLVLCLSMTMFVVPVSAASYKELTPCKYDLIEPFYDDLAFVMMNGKQGYIDKNGKEVIPCKYDLAWLESDCVFVYVDGKYGYMDKSGKEIIPCKYEKAGPFSEGLARVVLNGKYGYIDKSGKEIIPCKYEGASSFSSEGLASVVLNGKYGYIDKNGKEIIPCKYDYIWEFSEGLAWAVLNGKYGYIDKNGKEITPFKYEDAGSFSEGLAGVVLNGKYSYIDKSGKAIISCKYEKAGSFSEGLARVVLNGKYGYIDKSGKEIIPCKYKDASSFSEGIAFVKENNGLYGCIDKSGKAITAYKYSSVGDYMSRAPLRFCEGMAMVSLNGKWGYIDKSGKEIITCKYDQGDDFFEGIAVVGCNGKYGCIDKSGKEIIPCKYEEYEAQAFSAGILPVWRGDECTWYDKRVIFGFLEDDNSKSMDQDSLTEVSVIVTNEATEKSAIQQKLYEKMYTLETNDLAIVKENGKYGLISIVNSETQRETTHKPPEIATTVAGNAVMWTDAVPFIENGRTLVPLRAVAEALNLTVTWDGTAREAVFTDGTKTIYFPIGAYEARTSTGSNVTMDTAAVISNNRTYAPIRYLAEFFGYTVGWDNATRTVIIE